MVRRFVWYDVFTSQRFAGNPLAVVPDATGLADEQMAAIARELNLSETTFVLPPAGPAVDHEVRIFTPTRELAFAGHPTIGTAVALADEHGIDAGSVVLGLGAGPTSVQLAAAGASARSARFVAPQRPRLSDSPADVAAVADALGLGAGEVARRMPLHVADVGGTAFLVVAVDDLGVLGRARLRASIADVVGVFVVAPDGDGFRARMFAPEAGVVEDPATGSASCAFAGSLVAHIARFGTSGTHRVAIRQGVEMGRPSELGLEFDVAGGAVAEVRLAGAAVRVLSGELEV